MSQYEELMRALQERQGRHDQISRTLEPLQRRRDNYETKRMGGWLGVLGETIFDAIQRKKYEPQYQSALAEAMGSARGVDQAQAELAQYEAMLAEAKKQAEADRLYQRERVDKAMDFAQEQGGKAALEGVKAGYRRPERPPAPRTQVVTSTRDGNEVQELVDLNTGSVINEISRSPKPKTAQEVKQETAQETKTVAEQRLLYNLMETADLLTDPHFDLAVGPFDAGGLSREAGAYLNSNAYNTRKWVDRIIGEKVLATGGEVLKGSQTIEEWRRIETAMPAATDHPEVWRRWFISALNTLSAGRPDLAEQLEPLYEQIRSKYGEVDTPPEGARKVSSPQEAQTLPPGTRYITPDGKEYVR